MKTTVLSPAQTEALMDLLLLGLYADAHLSLSEEGRLQELLATLPLPANIPLDSLLPAAFGRVRAAVGDPIAEEKLLRELSVRLGSPEVRQSALTTLGQVLRADTLATRELTFEDRAKQAFGL